MRGSPRCDKDLMAGPGSGEIIQGVEDWEEQDIAWPRLERPLLRLWWRCCTKLGHESKTSTISIYFEQARSLMAQWLSTLLLSNGKGLGFLNPLPLNSPRPYLQKPPEPFALCACRCRPLNACFSRGICR